MHLRRITFVLSVSLLTVLAATAAMTFAQTLKPPLVNADSTALVGSHVESSQEEWKSYWDYDYGVNVEFGSIEVTTPPDSGTYTTVVRLTLEYRTTPGDSGTIGLSIGTTPPFERVAPGGYALGPSPDRRTTTLTWAVADLLPDTTYQFHLGAATMRRTGDTSTLWGYRSVTTVDLTR